MYEYEFQSLLLDCGLRRTYVARCDPIIKGKFKLPERDRYFEMAIYSARTGSIGKLKDFKIKTKYGDTDLYIGLYFEDKKKTVYFSYHEVVEKINYNGPTIYIYKTSPKPKKVKSEIAPRKNNFGQELVKGALVIAVTNTKFELVVGHVTRWNDYSVWAEPHGCFGKTSNKHGDVPIKWRNSIVVRDEDHLKDELFSLMLSMQ